jgi:hypothetical protein
VSAEAPARVSAARLARPPRGALGADEIIAATRAGSDQAGPAEREPRKPA